MRGINFYKNRICLNCLTNSLENARDIWDAMEGHVLVGLLSADYPDVDSAVKDMKRYQEILDNHISVGLGAGNPGQWKVVAEIAGELKPGHINQTFTGGGYTRARAGAQPIMNSMVAPCGQAGFVRVSTGPISKDLAAAVVPVETAIAAGVERVIPHVYSSIIDKATGVTRVDDVKVLFGVMQRVT